MSRIRSIHPGLFTDEAFMEASIPARMLIMGLWCEAWDDGVFEIKPLTIKARVFPADAVSVLDLLQELERLSFFCRFEADGKVFGAIRNFRKWQRPKTPNKSGVLPDGLRKYVGITDDDSGNVSEKVPQREDEGGRREETD